MIIFKSFTSFIKESYSQENPYDNFTDYSTEYFGNKQKIESHFIEICKILNIENNNEEESFKSIYEKTKDTFIINLKGGNKDFICTYATDNIDSAVNVIDPQFLIKNTSSDIADFITFIHYCYNGNQRNSYDVIHIIDFNEDAKFSRKINTDFDKNLIDFINSPDSVKFQNLMEIISKYKVSESTISVGNKLKYGIVKGDPSGHSGDTVQRSEFDFVVVADSIMSIVFIYNIMNGKCENNDYQYFLDQHGDTAEDATKNLKDYLNYTFNTEVIGMNWDMENYHPVNLIKIKL